MLTVLLILSFPALLIVSAYCSAMETALFSLSFHDRLRVRKLSPSAAAGVTRLLAQPRALLVTLLFLNTLVNTLYFSLSSLVLLGAENPVVGVLINIINLVALTVVAEVVSKMLAGRLRVELAVLLAPSVVRLFDLLGPLRVFLDRGILAPLVRVLVPQTTGNAQLTEDELSQLLSLGREQGAIDADEVRALRQVIAFGQRRVRDVMTPRVEMTWINDRSTRDEVREVVARTRLTRIPVMPAGSEELDERVLGLLNTKRHLARLARSPNAAITESIDTVRFVPEHATLDKLLENFRKDPTKVALVVNELGEVVGVVSVQDIAARLVAEIAAVDGVAEQDARIELVGLGVWEVSGRLSARDWADMFRLRFDSRASTVAGLVTMRLGRIARVGDTVRIGNVQLEVRTLDGRVPERIAVSIFHDPAQGPAERRS
jgi:putative hemolysin